MHLCLIQNSIKNVIKTPKTQEDTTTYTLNKVSYTLSIRVN